MSPTILIYNKYRFFFNSREEKRRHIHVATADGTAKFWLEPIVGLADYWNLTTKELSELKLIVEEKQDEFKQHWDKHLTNSVTNIASFGFWFLCDDKEYFVSFNDYPAFKKASVDSIFNVKQISPKQFYWEDVDVDIEIDALEKPDDFPLSFNK